MSKSSAQPTSPAQWHVALLRVAVKGYSSIVSRKHGLVPPTDEEIDAMNLSQLEQILIVLKDLAHVPPQ